MPRKVSSGGSAAFFCGESAKAVPATSKSTLMIMLGV
jgi:hypothetical protein